MHKGKWITRSHPKLTGFPQMITSKSVSKMDLSKKRKFESEPSSLPLSKHACFDNVACSGNSNGRSELDSISYVSSTSVECNNEIEMKEESSGSCGGDKMISFHSHLDFIYGTHKLEDYSEKDIESILYPNDEVGANGGCSNAANYLLSSGRWTVNQDSTTRHGTNKPTIDLEFEQYFSTLML